MSIAEPKAEPMKYMSGGFFGLDSTIGNLLGGLLSDGLIATVKNLFEGDEQKPEETPFKNTYYTFLNNDEAVVKDLDNKIMSLLDSISIQNPKMKYKKEDTPNPLLAAADNNKTKDNAEPKTSEETPNLNTKEDKTLATEEMKIGQDKLSDVESVPSEKKSGGAGMPPGVEVPGMPPGVEVPGMPPGVGVPGMPKTMNVADLLKPSDVLGMFIDPNKMKVLAGLIIQNQDGLANDLVSRNAQGVPNYLSKVFEPGKIKELVEEGKVKYLNNLKTKKSNIHDVFLESLKKKLKEMVLTNKESKIEFCKKFNEVFTCTK